jgi:SAM-dependent methyltransferase
VTLSPRQVDLSTRSFLDCAKLSCARYDNLDPVATKYDVIYSVEALVHNPNLTKTLQHWALHLSPGGKIVILHDYLIDGGSTENNEDAQIYIFADSWLLGSLVSLNQFEEAAKLDGLVRGDKRWWTLRGTLYNGTTMELCPTASHHAERLLP